MEESVNEIDPQWDASCRSKSLQYPGKRFYLLLVDGKPGHELISTEVVSSDIVLASYRNGVKLI